MARHAVLSLLLVATACQQVDGGTRNVPPVAVLVSHADGDVVREGYAETLRGAVGDADHGLDDLSISWRVDGVEVCADATADGQGRVVCAHSFLATGGEVTLEVRDPVGGTAAAGASLAVRSTDVAVDLTPDPAFTTDTLLADVSEMSDAEGLRPLTYSYVWYADDAVSPASVSERFPSSETSKHRKYRVVVTPSNGVSSGPPVEAEVTIANAAPELVGPTLSADVVQVGDVLECSATATDADADDAPAIAYAWEDGGTAAAHSVTTADVPGTTLSCTATADDGDGGTASSTVSARVENSPPELDTVEVHPSSGRVGDTLTCAATASDPNGGNPSVTYVWTGGVAGSTYAVREGDDPGAVLTCTATATDIDGGTASGSAVATVLNTAPVLTGVSITPGSAHNDDTLTCVATASDVDGGALGFGYAWVGSIAGPLGTGGSVDLSTTAVSSGETVTCVATASDTDGGSAADAASLTVSNRDPQVSVSLSPGTDATRSDTLTCSATAADDDDDGVVTSFAWTVAGVAVAASSSSADTSTLQGAFVAGELVTCTATTSDGKGGTDTAAASITIRNAAPTVSAPSLTPATVYTGDTLAANVTTLDADGDSLVVTYDWYVDGALVQTGADNTLDGTSWFDKDQSVHVAVTADDGTDTVTETSGAVTIANTAPTAPVIAIVPGDAMEGDPLVCEVVTPSTDVDGDAVAYTMAWTEDGVTYSGVGDTADTGATLAALSTTTWSDDTVPGGVALEGTEWECSATPSDGDDVGTTGSDSVVVRAATPTWAVVWSHSLSSAPAGASTSGGGWLGQGPNGVGGRAAWQQRSDHNRLNVPVSRSSTRYEAVEFDVYFSGTIGTSVKIFPFSTGLRWNQQRPLSGPVGAAVLVGTEVALSDFIAYNTWTTIRMEIDASDLLLDLYIGGVLVEEDLAITDASILSGTTISMQAFGVAYTHSPGVGWSNLRVYEGTL